MVLKVLASWLHNIPYGPWAHVMCINLHRRRTAKKQGLFLDLLNKMLGTVLFVKLPTGGLTMIYSTMAQSVQNQLQQIQGLDVAVRDLLGFLSKYNFLLVA